MRVEYHGSHDKVVVMATGHVAERDGLAIDVPDEIGRSLIEQDTWSEAETPAPQPAAKKKD